MTPSQERVLRELVAQVTDQEHKTADLKARLALARMGLDVETPPPHVLAAAEPAQWVKDMRRMLDLIIAGGWMVSSSKCTEQEIAWSASEFRSTDAPYMMPAPETRHVGDSGGSK